MSCQFCGKEISIRGLKNHEIRCSKNPDRVLQKPHNPEDVKRKLSIATTRYYADPANREKHSKIMQKAVLDNPESYSDRNVVGRSKHFICDGVRYNSTWEYVVATYLTEMGIKWVRSNIKPIPYQFENRWHLYFPDFLLEEYNVYVEVKGYQTDRDVAKWSQADKKVIVLKDAEIKSIKNGTFNINDVL